MIVGLGITLQAALMLGSRRKASQSDSLSPRVARTARENQVPEDRLSNLPRPRRSVRLPESAGEGQGGGDTIGWKSGKKQKEHDRLREWY